jgi:hypothetical protein
VTGPRPAVSVVVMGYRNEATIVEAVASLLGQSAPEPFEVVVVTSGGDRSAEAVRAAFAHVEVVESPVRLLPGGARNAGVAATSGEIVAFLAADCLAEPGWIAARLAAHRAGHPLVAGAMTAGPPARPAAWGSHYALFCHRLPGQGSGPIDHHDPAAHGLSFERAVLDRLKGFDADLRVGEDTRAAHQLGETGVGVWLAADVRTAHRGPRNAWAMAVDHHRRGARSIRTAAVVRPLSRGRALLGYPVTVALIARSIATIAWRTGQGERARLVVSMPWLVTAVAAGHAGRYRERLRATRSTATSKASGHRDAAQLPPAADPGRRRAEDHQRQ